MKKTKKNEVVEAEVKECEELTELPEAEDIPTEEEVKEEKKKPFWKSKKFLVGAGVLGGVAIAALSIFGINKASEVPYGLDSYDPCGDCLTGNCGDCPHNDTGPDEIEEDSSEENSDE